MIKLCEACRYELSDCRGDKEDPQDCRYYRKPLALNAKELAKENVKLLNDLEFAVKIICSKCWMKKGDVIASCKGCRWGKYK